MGGWFGTGYVIDWNFAGPILSAAIAAGSGLIGAFIGSRAAIKAVKLQQDDARRARNEELKEVQRHTCRAIAAEIGTIGDICEARSTGFRRQAARGQLLPSTYLQKELIGQPFYYSKLGDQVRAIPLDLVEYVAIFYALCAAYDSALQRNMLVIDIDANALLALANMLDRLTERATATTLKLRAT